MPWADGLKQKIKEQELERASTPPFVAHNFQSFLRPVSTFPVLFRWNGIGFGLYGRLSDPEIPQGYLKIYFLSFLWMPLIPLCVFAVDGADNGYHVYGRSSLWSVARFFKWRTILFYLSAWLEGAAWLILFVVAIGIAAFAVRGLASFI